MDPLIITIYSLISLNEANKQSSFEKKFILNQTIYYSMLLAYSFLVFETCTFALALK